MKELRCAIYARFSSDRQSPTSISDQIRKCRDYASRQGWHVIDQHVYSDGAIAATSMAGKDYKSFSRPLVFRIACLIAF